MAEVERAFAELVGCDQAIAGSSTLHLFWDLFGWFAKPGIQIFVDGATYPIGRWGVARAALAGVPVHYFPEHDVEALRNAINTTHGATPVIVADGFCPACDRAAPLCQYVELAGSRDGWVIVDDSQALGLFGWHGGGSLRKFGLTGSNAILVSSLAKALGVPMAMLAGRALDVQQIRAQSDIRVHCSPPSVPILNAAARALKLNAEIGDCLRARLARRVARFRNGLKQLGLEGNCSLFPMQRLRLPGERSARDIYERLLQRQVRCVLHRGRNNRGAQISFIITARHSLEDIDKAIYALESASGGTYAVA
jgi:8-amino-7-oxononanoate synthase